MSWPGEFVPGATSPDRFPLAVDQHADRDDDGYGDHTNGWQGDVWPDDPMRWSDQDADGFTDQVGAFEEDMCPTQRGTSTDPATRGCPDSDGDGVVDLADVFPLNPFQWADSDGDGLGDNDDGSFKSDACPRVHGNATSGTLLGHPDTDGDGWADAEYPSLRIGDSGRTPTVTGVVTSARG